MNQQQKILDILKDKEYHCVTEFINSFMIDYRRRICDLKEKGYTFDSRKCQNPNHNHQAGLKEWRLVNLEQKTLL